MRIDHTSTAVAAVLAIGASMALWHWQAQRTQRQQEKKQDEFRSGSNGVDNKSDDNQSNSSSTAATQPDDTILQISASPLNPSSVTSAISPTSNSKVCVKATSIGTDKTIFGGDSSIISDAGAGTTINTESVAQQQPQFAKEEEETKKGKKIAKEESEPDLRNFRAKDIPDFTIELDDDDADMF